MSKDYIFEPRPVFSSYTPNLFLGSYYIEDDFQADPSMWADPLEDAFVTNAGMKEGKIPTVTYLQDFSAETLLMGTKKLDELEVLPQSYFWKWDHYDAQLQIPTEMSEDDFESPAYEEFLEAAVGYDSDNPYFLSVVDSFMDEGEDIDIWPEEADWSRIQTTVRWWKLYDLWMEDEGVDFLTNLAHEDYDWSIRNAGELQNIGYEIPEPDDDDYYWSMHRAENEGSWSTFGRVDYNWATDPDDLELTDEQFWRVDGGIRSEIRYRIDSYEDRGDDQMNIVWENDGLFADEYMDFTVDYSWGPNLVTGVNSAEGFEAEVCPCGCAMVGCVCSPSCKGECLGSESFSAEMGDLVKDNEWIVFGTKKTGGTTQGNQGMMLGRSPSLKGAKKMMENFRKKGYGNRYATIGKRLKRQKALLGGLLEAEGDVCWRCAEYGDKIPSHCKNCGVCEECECAVECESRETLGSETLVWKDKTLSFMDWAKQEEASHLKKYRAESDQFPSMHYGDYDSDSQEKYQDFIYEWDLDDDPPSFEEWYRGNKYHEAEVCPCGCAMVGCVCSPSCKGECLGAESFEAPYTGAGSLMGITGDTDLSSFTPDELTKSSAIHGDFDTASLDYSGHQNIEVRAESSAYADPAEMKKFYKMIKSLNKPDAVECDLCPWKGEWGPDYDRHLAYDCPGTSSIRKQSIELYELLEREGIEALTPAQQRAVLPAHHFRAEEDHLECSRCGDSSPVYFGILSLCKSCQKLVDSYPAYLRAELKRVSQELDTLKQARKS